MKNCLKTLLFAVLIATSILTVSVFAENEIDMPQDWIDGFTQLEPESATAIIARFPDMPDDWSTDALVKAVQNGLLSGSDGYILPQQNLTRAQLATIMVRAFGAQQMADVSSFTDLSANEWYYENMAKAVKMDIFRGDGSGTIRPDDSISRQEVFVVISRAFNITGADASVLNTYPDAADVADWAKDATASLIANGYVGGSNGFIKPTAPITRAEFAQIMKNLVDAYITEGGVYTTLPKGNIVIRATGVVIDGAAISGNVYIGEGVGNSITLSNVTCSKRVVVRGGTSTVLTGTFETVAVVGNGLTVNTDEATIKNAVLVGDSVITTMPGKDNSDNLDNDGDGWTDKWF